jgi:hypothetical protein
LEGSSGESGSLTSVAEIGGQGYPIDGSASVLALSDDLDNTFVVLATGAYGAFGFRSPGRSR